MRPSIAMKTIVHLVDRTTIEGSRYHRSSEDAMHMMGQLSGRLIEWHSVLTAYLTVLRYSQHKNKIEIKYLQH